MATIHRGENKEVTSCVMAAPPATPVDVFQLSRGLFRFSLRTLMIGATLVAVMLGLVVVFK